MPASTYQRPSPATKAAASKGRSQAKASPRGKLHTDFAAVYAKREPKVDLFKQVMRVTARTARGVVDLSPLVSELSWTDDSAAGGSVSGQSGTVPYANTNVPLTGTLQMTKPSLNQYRQLVRPLLSAFANQSQVPDGMTGISRWGAMGVVVILEVGYGRTWLPMWAQRVQPTDSTVAEQVSLSDGTWTLNLTDDLQLLNMSMDDFKFTRGKRTRRDGWRCDEIAVQVCQQYGVPVKQLARGTARFELSSLDTRKTQPLGVIAAAYLQEEYRTGRAFIIRWAAPDRKFPIGALEVVPMRRNPNLLRFRDQLTDAILTRTQQPTFATSLLGRAMLRHGTAANPPKSPAVSGGATGGGIFLLGDSILVGASADLTRGLSKAGWTPLIDGLVSRPLTAGVSILQARPRGLSNANAVVIELGTNSSGDSTAYASQVAAAIAAVRAANSAATIYWVNLFSNVTQKDAYNGVLNRAGVTVIDANTAHISLGGDGIHPDTAGAATLSNLIVQAVGGGGGTSGGKGGKPITYSYVNETAVRRFGFIHRIIDFPPVASMQELQVLTKRQMAFRLMPLRTAALTHPGIATIRRGDAIRIDLPEEGYGELLLDIYEQPRAPKSKQTALALKLAELADPMLFGVSAESAFDPTSAAGLNLKNVDTADVQTAVPVADQSIAFVTEVQHTASSGTYSMDMQTTFVDALDPTILKAEIEANIRQGKLLQRVSKPAASRSGSGRSGGGGSSSASRWRVTASAEVSGGTGACRVIQDTGYSELSTNPSGPLDFAALGKLPCMTELKITNPANGQSVTAVKQDVGAGSSFLPVMGLYPGTVSALGLTGGEFTVVIERVDGAPLHPVRGTQL